MRLARIGLALSLLSAGLLVAGPLGTRLALWSFLVGFALLALSLLLGLTGAGLSLAGGLRTGAWARAFPGVGLGLLIVAVPSFFLVSARGAPPIHEITTDTADPPAFVAALLLRASAANPAEYGGAAVAAQQATAFPDIQPLLLTETPAAAYRRALAAAQAAGWDVVAQDEAAGRIEAVATTFWFGFKDDVVVRLRPAASGTRVDVRSKSRVGLGDAGTNARRVRAFLASLQQ
jgi:uncharacterized protein (DUF1499 family)